MQKWYDWLIIAVHIKESEKGAYKGFESKVMALYNKVNKALKRPAPHDEVEEEAQEDYIGDIQHLYKEPQEDRQSANTDLAPREHKHALHKIIRSFRIPGSDKADVDRYITMVRPGVKTLVKEQVKDMGFAKIQLSM